MRSNRHKNRLPPFVPLLIETLDAPAWRAMSHGAKALYVALRRRFSTNNHNNGRIFLSQRHAAEELKSHHNEIARWFRELQHYGFIVMTTPGVLGIDGKGKAPRWRLTELGCMREPPTRDFTRWGGSTFKNAKTKSRAGNGARGVQENKHTGVPENRSPEPEIVPEKAHISAREGVRENQHRTRLPYAAADQRRAHFGSAIPAEASPSQSKTKRVRVRLSR